MFDLFSVVAATGFQEMEATGGTESTITVSGRRWKVHTFTSNGTFTVSNDGYSCPVEYLIVGGGGGTTAFIRRRSVQKGGGGGGGGFLSGVIENVTPGSYSVIVGAGGTKGTWDHTSPAVELVAPTSGGNSSVFGFTALGGGRGGWRAPYGGSGPENGADGGSGGGGTFESGLSLSQTSGGSGTAGQGFNGANATTDSGGGGGGAGGLGQGSQGGPGKVSNITGSDYTYAPGGSGAGGGGNGQVYGAGGNGVTVTSGSNGNGTDGFAGIVILRYPLDP